MFDVVGPICESGDFLAKDREMPVVKKGELLAVMSAGAYGFSMASNYNSRPRAAEVMVRGSEYFVVRERETYRRPHQGRKDPGVAGRVSGMRMQSESRHIRAYAAACVSSVITAMRLYP